MRSQRIDASWAGASKWATREGGDAIAVLQAPSGALFGALVDVQGTGSGAGVMARSLATLAGQLAGEGLDATSIAAAVNRSLWTRRGGRVLADVAVIIASGAGPVEIARFGAIAVAKDARHGDRPGATVAAAGGAAEAKPALDRLDGDTGAIVVCSDGVADSSERLARLIGAELGRTFDASDVVRIALERDGGRARNDMSAIVLRSAEVEPVAQMSVEGRLVLHRREIAVVTGRADNG